MSVPISKLSSVLKYKNNELLEKYNNGILLENSRNVQFNFHVSDPLHIIMLKTIKYMGMLVVFSLHLKFNYVLNIEL